MGIGYGCNILDEPPDGNIAGGLRRGKRSLRLLLNSRCVYSEGMRNPHTPKDVRSRKRLFLFELATLDKTGPTQAAQWN